MNPELDELRGVDLLEVMSALGYQPVARYTGSCEFRLEDGRKVSVSRTPHNAKKGPESMFQVWNGESFNGKSGGAGAIDLVMTVSNKTFRAALGWLASTFSRLEGWMSRNGLPVPLPRRCHFLNDASPCHRVPPPLCQRCAATCVSRVVCPRRLWFRCSMPARSSPTSTATP